MAVSLKKLLERRPIHASAPCRVDAGGTWDIKTLALPFTGSGPTTINIALNLRTEVILSPFTIGRIRISSQGFKEALESPGPVHPLKPPFGLFMAAVSFFGFHGLHVHIQSESPVKSALGGSSTALIALIKALYTAKTALGKNSHPSPKHILHLGYHLEDGLSEGTCGVQDQAAAVYGGVNQWVWAYENLTSFYRRVPLLARKDHPILSRSVLVAYSGKRHVSARINRGWVKDFLSGKTRSGWMAANEVVHKLAKAMRRKAWAEAAGLLREEMAIRREITPDALIPVTEHLIDQAERSACGARFTGAGAGGTVWALGPPKNILRLKPLWDKTLRTIRGGRVLTCSVDSYGVK